MGTRTFLCDIGWTIGKLELDLGEPDALASPPDPAADQLVLMQPADDTNAALSLAIVGREQILRLADFIKEAYVLDED